MCNGSNTRETADMKSGKLERADKDVDGGEERGTGGAVQY